VPQHKLYANRTRLNNSLNISKLQSQQDAANWHDIYDIRGIMGFFCMISCSFTFPDNIYRYSLKHGRRRNRERLELLTNHILYVISSTTCITYHATISVLLSCDIILGYQAIP